MILNFGCYQPLRSSSAQVATLLKGAEVFDFHDQVSYKLFHKFIKLLNHTRVYFSVSEVSVLKLKFNRLNNSTLAVKCQ